MYIYQCITLISQGRLRIQISTLEHHMTQLLLASSFEKELNNSVQKEKLSKLLRYRQIRQTISIDQKKELSVRKNLNPLMMMLAQHAH